MSRGNDGQIIFLDDEDCRIFLGILEDIARKTGCKILAYALMVNHYHLLVRVGIIPLSVVMHRFLSRYVRYFNDKYDRRGHLFQSRFKSKLCMSNAYLIALFRYIHNNPVEAGLAAAPEAWLWSSYHQYLSAIRSTLIDVDGGLALLGKTPELARRRLARLMGQTDEGFEPRFDADVRHKPKPPAKLAPARLEEFIRTVQEETGIDIAHTPGASRSPVTTRARREFSRRAAAAGYSNSVIARAMGLDAAAVTYYLRT